VNLGYAESRNTDLSPGDLDQNYAGGVSPVSKHLTRDEGIQDNETPERLMISKERWETVTELIRNNPEVCENLEITLDHFAGYSWAEIAEKNRLSREVVRHRVGKTILYLQKKIKGKQF
jgi:DNA-directed RNA polymerase specialized sigma24 family protein